MDANIPATGILNKQNPTKIALIILQQVYREVGWVDDVSRWHTVRV